MPSPLLSINIADRHTSKQVNRTLHISCIFCSKKKGTLSDALVHSSKYCQWYPAHVLPPLRAWDIEDGCFPTCIPTSLTVSYTVLSLLAMRRVVSPIIDRVPTFVHRLYGRYPDRAVPPLLLSVIIAMRHTSTLHNARLHAFSMELGSLGASSP